MSKSRALWQTMELNLLIWYSKVTCYLKEYCYLRQPYTPPISLSLSPLRVRHFIFTQCTCRIVCLIRTALKSHSVALPGSLPCCHHVADLFAMQLLSITVSIIRAWHVSNLLCFSAFHLEVNWNSYPCGCLAWRNGTFT